MPEASVSLLLFGTKILNNFHDGIKQTCFLIDWQRDRPLVFKLFNGISFFYNIRPLFIKCFLLAERNYLYFSAHENRETFPYITISFKTEAIPFNYFIFNTWLFSFILFPNYFYQWNSK